MTTEHLYIILFSIPVYQLFYFTTQVIIAKQYHPKRILGGLFLLLVSLMAVINAFIFYQSPAQYLYVGLFYALFVTAASTLFFFSNCVKHPGRKVVGADVLKHYIFPAAFTIVGMGVLLIPNEIQNADTIHTVTAGSSSGLSYKYFNIGFSGIAILYFLGKIFATLFSIASLVKRRIKAPKSFTVWEKEKKYLPAIYFLSFIVLIALLLFHITGMKNNPSLLITYNLILLLPGGLLGQQLTTLLNNSQPVSLSETHKKRTIPGTANEPSPDGGLSPFITSDAIPPIITREEKNILQEKLQKVMEEEKPFTNPRFSLDDLCLLLGINKRKAGYLINHVMKNNFYGLINEYRVEESIKLLNSDEHKKFTIETIALMAGFQSKSSFYAAFKKYKNITPGEYKEIKAL